MENCNIASLTLGLLISRLLTAANPESGAIGYICDNNGNLTRKTDARGIQTNYTYDALNRVTLRDYSDATPDVTYTYDNLANAKGKLIKVSSSVSTTEYTSFDIFGRVTGHRQTTDGVAYNTSYIYNLSGALIEETYPSGRKVKNTLDAEGDLALVQTQASGGAWQTRAGNFTYTAAGAVGSMQLGNGRWESTQFNSRLQPEQIALGTTQNGTDLLKLNYSYDNGTAAANNGNVMSQTITVPSVGTTPGFIAVQNYTYDSLNRLKSATETVGGVQSWKQTYLYDRYGNRNFDVANTTTLGSCSQPQCNPTIDTATNRFASGQGYTYDLSGNIVTDAEDRTFYYDAENKQKEVRDASNVTIGQYSYDGDGKRVKKISNQENIVFVYDAAGKLIEEYSNQTVQTAYVYAGPRLLTTETATGTSYLTNDHLGSPRINTNPSGTVTARHDYMPFGEEIFSYGGRTAGLGYSSDIVRKQFTGYERDGETDLDFAQARYYSVSRGRFQNPDPLLSSGKPITPQSWNRYAFVLNSPLILLDPTGLYVCQAGVKRCAEFDTAIENARAKLKNVEEKYGKDSKQYKKYEKLERALNVYGEKGKNNGVFIRSEAGAGAGRVGVNGYAVAETPVNPNGQRIIVSFDPEAFSNSSFESLVAHEGSHAADGSDWVKSGFKENMNPTWYQSETDAYTVSSLYAEISGSGRQLLDTQASSDIARYIFPPEIWNPSWKEADVATLRQAAIDYHLRFDKDYKLTPASTRKTFRKGDTWK